MLSGALAAYAVTVETGSLTLGVFAGALAGLMMAAVHGAMVVYRNANQLATGIAVMFLALGVTSLLGRSYVGVGIDGMDTWHVPLLSDIPFLGPILFQHDPLTYLAILLAPVVWWMTYRSRAGLLLRAAGERGEVLYAYGHSPAHVRMLAVCAGGLLAGLGGAQLSVAYAVNWSEDMTQGRGFVAVALVIFAAWNPLGAMWGSLFFGGVLSLQLQLQAEGVGVSPFFLDALPYVATILVLIVFSRRHRNAAPEGLARLFDTSAAR